MADFNKSKSPLLSSLQKYYESFDEATRLLKGPGKLEMVRTLEILNRFMPPPPAVVYDVGGATGAYSLRLAKQGYEVHLIDPVPSLIEQARLGSKKQPDYPVASIKVGDARKMEYPESSGDAILLFGPMYHLIDRSERLTALQEALRVLRTGGLLFAAVISRFASILDGLFQGFLEDPEFAAIVKRDMIDGQHRNPTGNISYFMNSFFHLPEEVREEIEEAGFQVVKILPIEGPCWLLQNFEEHWNDLNRRQRLLDAVRSLEDELSLLGISAHMMVVAQKN